jgi:hypothetical protein
LSSIMPVMAFITLPVAVAVYCCSNSTQV